MLNSYKSSSASLILLNVSFQFPNQKRIQYLVNTICVMMSIRILEKNDKNTYINFRIQNLG